VDWLVEIGDEFEWEFDALHEGVRIEILALSRLLRKVGQQLGRPRVEHAQRLQVLELEGTAFQRRER
jgi:hypothetical protein